MNVAVQFRKKNHREFLQVYPRSKCETVAHPAEHTCRLPRRAVVA